MKNKTRGKGKGVRGKVVLTIVVLGVLTAMPAFAQTASTARFDSRWNPWLGCWRLFQENVGEQNRSGASSMMVCVQPSGTTGVTMTTTVEGKTILEQNIVADGTAQPVKESDCDGLQTSDWSRDGERLFTRVELQCAGRPKQVISGVTLMAKGAWVDVQAVRDSDGDQDLRIRRYRRTSDQYAGVSGFIGTPMSVEDVIEASGKISSAALEATLDETGGRFNLNSAVLKQLADAGVSPNVIDLMVAQAFPGRFQVERAPVYAPSSNYGTSSMGSTNTTVFYGSQYPSPYYDPFYYNYYYYSPFAYPYYWGSGYRYNRYYGYGNYGNYYNFYGSPTSIVVPGGTTGTAQPITGSGSGTGQVVNGRGYTRVRPSSGGGDEQQQAPTERTVTPSAVRGVRSRGDSGSSSSSGSSPSGSSGGSVGGSGYSSGSSSSSSSPSSGGDSGGGGRTAQPR